MVCGDNNSVPGIRPNRLNKLFEALVDYPNCLYRCRTIACMPDHIRVSKVYDVKPSVITKFILYRRDDSTGGHFRVLKVLLPFHHSGQHDISPLSIEW